MRVQISGSYDPLQTFRKLSNFSPQFSTLQKHEKQSLEAFFLSLFLSLTVSLSLSGSISCWQCRTFVVTVEKEHCNFVLVNSRHRRPRSVCVCVCVCVCLCMYVCKCACVRARARARMCVRACVRACVRCVRACARVCVRMFSSAPSNLLLALKMINDDDQITALETADS